MGSDYESIVFDTGSLYSKAGFSGDGFPRSVFPSVIGRYRKPHLMEGYPEIQGGKEAIKHRGLSKLSWPVRAGFVVNWNDMEKLLHHAYYKEIQAPPEDYRVLHAIHPLMSRKYRENLAELMFESFNVKALYMANSAALALHATGRTTGLVWEGGAGCSHVVPVFEGFPLSHAIIPSILTGEKLTDILQSLLASKGYSFTTPVDMELLNNIKESMCYVSKDYNEDLQNSSAIEKDKITYTLPDGQQILLRNERFLCPESLFHPSIVGLECPGIVDTISTSISRCHLDHKPIFLENIVLAGGCSLFSGLEDRLREELKAKLKSMQGYKFHVEALENRQFAAWFGGSIVASLSALKHSWATPEEYDDVGVQIVHNKFF